MCSLLASSPGRDYCREDINERSPTHFLLPLVAWFLLNIIILERAKPTQNALSLWFCGFWALSSGLLCRAGSLGVWCRVISSCLSLRWGDQLLRWHQQQGQPPPRRRGPLQWALLWPCQGPHRLHTQSLRHWLAENQGETTARIPSFPLTVPGQPVFTCK